MKSKLHHFNPEPPASSSRPQVRFQSRLSADWVTTLAKSLYVNIKQQTYTPRKFFVYAISHIFNQTNHIQGEETGPAGKTVIDLYRVRSPISLG
jgi:hypothetical protein